MHPTDSMLCPKPQSDYTSNFKFPRAKENFIFSVNCSHQGNDERTSTEISWTQSSNPDSTTDQLQDGALAS